MSTARVARPTPRQLSTSGQISTFRPSLVLQAVSTALLACRPRLQPWLGIAQLRSLSSIPQPVSTGFSRYRLQPYGLIHVAIFTLALVSLPALAQEPPSADTTALAQRLDAAILRHKLGQFWGAVVVAKDGQVILAKGYGIANDNLDPITRDSLFDIGSISKQVTAAAILKLETQGKLNIDDSVATYCPDVSERGHGVTLRHLLNHTAGLNDSVAIQRLDFDDRDAAVRLAIASKPNSAPGEKFEYSNAGYVVLAAIVEKVSGKKFEDYVREELFKPAGLKSSGFIDGIGLDPTKQTARVITYNGRERRATLFTSKTGEPWAWGLKGAGGIVTTLDDLVRWDEALRTEQVLSNEAKAKLYQVAKGGYAMGWFIDTTPNGGKKIHHSGGTRGYRAQYSRYIDGHIVIAVLTNENNDPNGIEKMLAKEILPETSDSLQAELDLNALSMTQFKSAELDHGILCTAATERARIVLRATTKDGKPIAKVSMTNGGAASLLNQIRAQMHPDGANNPDAGVMIGTLPYTLTPAGKVTLPETVTWSVMPAYHGTNPETGETKVDPRTTLVIVDEDNSFWPLILKLNHPAAKQLADQLERAAAEMK